ncbi:hypothetical protein [Cytobacillus firmus]|uniref:hypothetical protein n=1 Tax=Cytobacillus firmus TaxID=1399 RepID=UPI002493E77E|nr:hypothetical protein [Cytobacillus firmus]
MFSGKWIEQQNANDQMGVTDINTVRREAHIGQIMLYDQRDQYTELTRNVASKLQTIFEIEQNLSRISIHNLALTSLATMKMCIISLFEGILTVKIGSLYYRCNPKEAEEIVMKHKETQGRFW